MYGRLISALLVHAGSRNTDATLESFQTTIMGRITPHVALVPAPGAIMTRNVRTQTQCCIEMTYMALQSALDVTYTY